jgi:membrane-associated protease RseP (regulator of RpoE activity)
MKTPLPTSLLCSVAAAVLLSACASGYQTAYRPVSAAAAEAIAARRAGPAPAEPLIERVTGQADQAFFMAYARRGYAPMGTASFVSERKESDAAAVQQARTVGADLVVIAEPVHRGSSTRNIPLTLPTTTTAHSSGTATVYGSGGTATAYGNATTTLYGTQTSIIPITVNHTGYGAVFFVKQRLALGVHTRPLTDPERARLQSNKGVVIMNVVDGSAAYNADLLVGDIILNIDGEVVTTSEAMNALLGQKKGRTVRIKFNRDGKELEKEVTLGA